MARRRARAERRAAAQRQATDLRREEAVLPPVRAGPRALALRLTVTRGIQDRVPTHEEVAAYLLNRPSRNRLTRDQIKRRQWLPLPPRAPKIEESVFKFRKSDKTGHGLADMLLELLCDQYFNDIGDKRRELLHFLNRSNPAGKEFTRLSEELAGLEGKALNKIEELSRSTGYITHLPGFFNTFPALNK